MAQQPSPVFSQAGMTFPQGLAGLSGPAFGHMSQQGAPLILPPTPTAALNPYAVLQQGNSHSKRLKLVTSFQNIWRGMFVFLY